MTRAYDVRTIALTLGVSPKWVDNLLSHHRIHGAAGGRQGVPRRVSAEGLVAIEVARLLALHLDVPMRRAAAIASSVVATRGAARDGAGEACIVVAPGVQLSIDLADVERRLRERLLDAVESVPRVTRGRPPGRRAVS